MFDMPIYKSSFFSNLQNMLILTSNKSSLHWSCYLNEEDKSWGEPKKKKCTVNLTPIVNLYGAIFVSDDISVTSISLGSAVM